MYGRTELTDRHECTLREGIAGISLVARTDRNVIEDVTLGVGSARSRTGIPALLVHASQLTGALCAYHAFRTTVRRSADEIGQTGASRLTAD